MQACLALLVGAGVFYIAAPHSWGIGIFISEPIYAGISLVISQAILIPAALFLFKKKQKYFFTMFFFSSIGIVLVVFLYPSSSRFTLPSYSIQEDIMGSLHETDIPSALKVSFDYRTKRPFDLFVEHEWTVSVSSKNPLKRRTFAYIERFGQGKLIIPDEIDWSKVTRKLE